MTPAADLLDQILGPIFERAAEAAFARVMAKQPKLAAVTKGGDLSLKDIAADLGVSTSALWRWRRAGTFIEPLKNPGGQVRFNGSEYDAWKQKRDRVRLR